MQFHLPGTFWLAFDYIYCILQIHSCHFGIVVLKEDLHEKNFAEIIPMVLIKRLRKPLGIIEPLNAFFIRNLAQGLVPEVPYFWTSNDQILVLKIP